MVKSSQCSGDYLHRQKSIFTQNKLAIAIKALSQLGIKQVSLYTLYQIGLKTGYFYYKTPNIRKRTNNFKNTPMIKPIFNLPSKQLLLKVLGKKGVNRLIAEAEHIKDGNYSLFGGKLRPLNLSSADIHSHWTCFAKQEHLSGHSEVENEDIKWIWEPARFGWAYILARAYYLTQDESYCKCFWEYTEAFLQANPPNMGIHWVSAQEVAIRLISLVFNWHIFTNSTHTTRDRNMLLSNAIVWHAKRIPPTLIYARSQNNNHLLSEAVALYTAALALPDHPCSSNWRKIGWKWFLEGLRSQIAEDGSYIQHSTNYHRIMLQLSLWMNCLLREQNQKFPDDVLERLRVATLWMVEIIEPDTGAVPNLGANDGAYIMPLSTADYFDYRPVIQACAKNYFLENYFKNIELDETSLWLEGSSAQVDSTILNKTISKHDVLSGYYRLSDGQHQLHAYLRVAKFRSRPSHADQLHLDIWWRGLNISKDAGTYLYNVAHPWDNALASTSVHNTLTVNGKDQMLRGGRFLWLDWAQAEILSSVQNASGEYKQVTAKHDGYRSLGLDHHRTVQVNERYIEVIDQLIPTIDYYGDEIECELNWLIPDLHWKLENQDPNYLKVYINCLIGSLTLEITTLNNQQGSNGRQLSYQVYRAGEIIHGDSKPNPILGWISPTYGYKEPGLSLRAVFCGSLPLALQSTWRFFEN